MSSDIDINSNESEGAFNEFIEDTLTELIDEIISNGDIDQRGSDVIIEMDEMKPPTFVYENQGGGAGQGAGQGPGSGGGKLKFSVPLKMLMDAISKRLRLPNLLKLGDGKIKEISYEFKTFGTSGVLLDRRRTFKRALKASVGLGIYDPENGDYDVQIRKKDKRFKLPERVEKPKFRAVVFYMGDISYSTMGERLELEKRVVNFIHYWLDYNYGEDNVDHRFFVHDSTAYEVLPEDFYNV